LWTITEPTTSGTAAIVLAKPSASLIVAWIARVTAIERSSTVAGRALPELRAIIALAGALAIITLSKTALPVVTLAKTTAPVIALLEVRPLTALAEASLIVALAETAAIVALRWSLVNATPIVALAWRTTLRLSGLPAEAAAIVVTGSRRA
jgi:hypothetical protein